MNWTELAAISETLSSLAVLITLIYLAVQTKQNTQSIRAAGQQTTASIEMQLLMQQATDSAVWARLPASDLTGEEQVKLSAYMAAFFRMRELDWFNFQNGVIDDATWASYRNTIKLFMGFPSLRKWWENTGPRVYDPSFVAHVDELATDVRLSSSNAFSDAFE